MMAARRKRAAGKPPEEDKPSQSPRKEVDKRRRSEREVGVGDTQGVEEAAALEDEPVLDFPFQETDKVPNPDKLPKEVTGFQNRAPLQADERARELLRSTLQHPISLTAEDLLNVSEPMRIELKKLLTKSSE
jgi:hypothetical protein